jgi:formate C-acetyltransferase
MEREILRRVPLGLAPDELLAGRIESTAEPREPVQFELLRDMYPHGQRAHTALDAEKLLRAGISGIESDIRSRMASSSDEDSCVFYESALISLDGFRELAARLRKMAQDLCGSLPYGHQRDEMARVADVLELVPEHPARTFHEAIQATHLLYFAGSVVVQSLYGPGRIDRILWSYYEADLREGRITRDEALQLICCQFMLMNHVYELPQPIMIGGTGPDGRDVTNDLTYLCLEADRLVGLVNPSLGLSVNKDTPEDLLDKAADSLLAGLTKPSLFSDDTIIAGLRQRGVPFEDAVDYIHSTCVEITVAGRSNILVASPYINLLKPLEFIMNGGRPMLGDEEPGDVNCHTHIAPPELDSYGSFEEFLNEYRRQLAGRIADAAEMIAGQRKGRAAGWAFPLASCFTADCIERGLDIDRGGARYTWTETSNVGLANITDSLMVIRKRVFEEAMLSLTELRDVLAADLPDESQRAALIVRVPRYGNDDPEADALAAEIVATIYEEHAKHRDGLGGWFVPGFFCWITHRVLGDQTAASPDGRHAGDVLADAAGAAQGRDTCGPTAAIRSITSWDHKPGLGGIVLNLRFDPSSFHGDEGRKAVVDLIRTYFSLGGFEVQVNAVGSEVLRDAQEDPERYADLLVRVAGYSDYFTLLDRKMQEEIIARTQHTR